MRAKKKIERLEESNRYYKKEYRNAVDKIQSLEDKNDQLSNTLETLNKIPEPKPQPKSKLHRFALWLGNKMWDFLEGK